jgi:pimeloyl-ACP methyl ester carboxylesterase
MNKPTLVLLPGLLSDHFIWQHQIAALQHVVDIIIPDTSRFDNTDELINHIITISPPQFYLAGHSMGGWLAIELMRKYSSHVVKLCILATSATLDSAKKVQLRKQSINLASTLTSDEIVNYLSQFYVYKLEQKPAIIEMFKRNITSLIPQQQIMLNRRSCKDILPTINIPTIVLVGEHDKEFFNSSKYIADHIPNAEFIVIKDSGHMLLLEQPEACTLAMLTWIKDSKCSP